MKDYCLELAAAKSGYDAKLNTMREYLQAYILRIMQQQHIFRTTAFMGGTALRFIYKLPRFSEDLDFSLVDQPDWKFADLIANIKKQFMDAGYNIHVKYKDQKTVQHAFFHFDQLLYDADLSPIRDQKFSIKLEVDTNPPRGAGVETKVSNIYFPVSFLTYDLPSLFAGKLHALLSRGFTKGRDFYDLAWYLSRFDGGIKPNFNMLNHALVQSHWQGAELNEKNGWSELTKIVKAADWKKVREDVEKFLENPKDMDVYTQETVLGLVASWDKEE
jgi:predicted nucleotidyltransferase component of viral defense system